MADPEEIKRKLSDLRARLSKTQESLERARQTIAPEAKGKPRKNSHASKRKDS